MTGQTRPRDGDQAPPLEHRAPSERRPIRTARRCVVAAALLAIALLVTVPLAACSRAAAPPAWPSPSVAPSSLDDAFAAAHPAGGVPPGLRKVAGTRLRAKDLGQRSRLRTVLVPEWLPPGYGLAAPYVSVGDGSALPNPYTWRGGYRASYTDGRGLLVLHVGGGRLPGEGVWERLPRRWRGARLWRRASDGLVVVAARRAAVPVAVAGAGVEEGAIGRVLEGLRTSP